MTDSPARSSAPQSQIMGSPCKRRRVVVPDPVEQGDAQPFALEAAGAVVGSLAREIALNRVGTQRAHAYDRFVHVRLGCTSHRIGRHTAVRESQLARRGCGELGNGGGVRPGLAEHSVIAQRQLIRADDERIRAPARARLRLGERQPLHPDPRRPHRDAIARRRRAERIRREAPAAP
jgi:hypothetical protein